MFKFKKKNLDKDWRKSEHIYSSLLSLSHTYISNIDMLATYL